MGVIAKSESKSDLIFTAGSFWPEIRIKDFKAKGRVPTMVDDESALYLLERAFVYFLDDIEDYEANQLKKGIKTLLEVESPIVGKRTKQVIHFESALFAQAKKLICDDYKDIDLARRAGEDKIKEIIASENTWSADYLKSVRSFLGKERDYVGLT